MFKRKQDDKFNRIRKFKVGGLMRWKIRITELIKIKEIENE